MKVMCLHCCVTAAASYTGLVVLIQIHHQSQRLAAGCLTLYINIHCALRWFIGSMLNSCVLCARQIRPYLTVVRKTLGTLQRAIDCNNTRRFVVSSKN
jgi:hypothetical protein